MDVNHILKLPVGIHRTKKRHVKRSVITKKIKKLLHSLGLKRIPLEPSEDRETVSIGRKIKRLRGKMSLSELARLSGVDKAIISKIENNKMLGTIECHQKLADVFGLSLSELYGCLEEGQKEVTELMPGENSSDTYDYFLQILTSEPLSKSMLPTFLTVKSGEEKILQETVKKVERFIIVLEGEVEIAIEGKTHHLKKTTGNSKGDSLYSRSKKVLLVKNTGKEPARLLCISCPPVL